MLTRMSALVLKRRKEIEVAFHSACMVATVKTDLVQGLLEVMRSSVYRKRS